jgi:hypothetical protein
VASFVIVTGQILMADHSGPAEDFTRGSAAQTGTEMSRVALAGTTVVL